MPTTRMTAHSRRFPDPRFGFGGEGLALGEIADGLGLERDSDPVVTPWRRSHRVTLRAATDVSRPWW